MISEPAYALGETILDLLMPLDPTDVAAALAHVIRHHAINAELIHGDDCTLMWLEQLRQAIDASEAKLGDYIERERVQHQQVAA
jgi:hypothetical protein